MTSEGPFGVLEARIEDDVLVIRIGISTLAFAAERMENNNPFIEDLGEYRQLVIVVDHKKFAEDALRSLLDEDEDGSHRISRMLDDAFWDAIGQGSEGVAEALADDK